MHTIRYSPVFARYSLMSSCSSLNCTLWICNCVLLHCTKYSKYFALLTLDSPLQPPESIQRHVLPLNHWLSPRPLLLPNFFDNNDDDLQFSWMLATVFLDFSNNFLGCCQQFLLSWRKLLESPSSPPTHKLKHQSLCIPDMWNDSSTAFWAQFLQLSHTHLL